jgi:hypothetical protein
MLMLLPSCKEVHDTDDTGVEPTYCELLGLTERPFQPAEHDRTLYALAADLTIHTLEGDWMLSEGWTGCDTTLFIQDLPRQDYGAPISIWERDLDDLFERLPPNVHLFFVSSLAEQEDRDQAIADLRAEIDEALAELSNEERGWWEEHVHYVPRRDRDLEGWLGDIMASPRWGAGIDRFQRIRYIGSYADLERWNSSYGWFEPNISMVANEPLYYDFEAQREERLEDQDATVVTLFDGTEVSSGTGPGQVDAVLPDAATMATFDTLELDLYLGCVGAGEFGTCPAWDYIVYLYLCDVADPETCDTELGRWITTYHREGRWVHDVSAMLPLLADGGTRRFVFSTSQPYEVHLSMRLFDQGKAARPHRLTYLFPGGAFDSDYNEVYTPLQVRIPPAAAKVELATVISGHGQVAPGTCAEFCEVTHHFTVNGHENVISYPEAGTAEDCMDKVTQGTVPNQYGTWWYGRNGWCPGKEVLMEMTDVTTQVTAGTTATIEYAGFRDGQPYTTAGASIKMHSWLLVSK